MVSKRIDSNDVLHLTQVNRKTAVQVCTILNEIGVPNIIAIVSDWNASRFRAIENFAAACIEFNLPFKLDSPQISTFIDRLDECYYTPSTLDSQWGILKCVARELQFDIEHEHYVHFKAVKANCREVSYTCLDRTSRGNVQCRHGHLHWISITACLARALFICAWAFSMRISEYSSVAVWKKPTDKTDKMHHIRYYAIQVSKAGLSV